MADIVARAALRNVSLAADAQPTGRFQAFFVIARVSVAVERLEPLVAARTPRRHQPLTAISHRGLVGAPHQRELMRIRDRTKLPRLLHSTRHVGPRANSKRVERPDADPATIVDGRRAGAREGKVR